MKTTHRKRGSYTVSPAGGFIAPGAYGKADTARAEICENLCIREGVVRKRPGWRQVAALAGRVNGIWAIPWESGAYLVHGGTHFYRLQTDTEPWGCTDVTASAPAVYRPGTLTDTRSQAFIAGGRLYVTGCGDYLVYGSWDAGATYQLRRVHENEDTTVPVTSFRAMWDDEIDPDADGKANRLTPWRRNAIGGIPQRAENNDAYSRYLWVLDSPVEPNSVFTFRYLDGVGTRQTLTFRANETFRAAQPLPSGALGGCVSVNLDRTHGYLWFYRPVSNYADDPLSNQFLICLPTDGTVASANIGIVADWGEALFRVPDANVPEAAVRGCNFGILYAGGGSGSRDRLYLAGNPASPGWEYYSTGGTEDFTYFPVSNCFAPGNATGEVAGFARLSDNTLAVFRKRHDPTDTGIYYQTLKSGKGNTDGGGELFTVEAGQLSEAPVSRHSAGDLGGEVLILSQSGVFGLTLTDNVATAERKTRERGRVIASAIAREENLAEAAAVVWRDRYYLAMNGHCYVADGRYRFKPTGTLEDESEYEWWFWQNVPARVFGRGENALLFGTDEGRICVFDDEFSDRTYTPFSAGEVTLDDQIGGLTVSQDLPVQVGDCLRLTGGNLYARLYPAGAAAEDGRIALPAGYDTLPEGLLLAAAGLDPDAEEQSDLTAVRVTDVDPGTGTFSLTDGEGAAIVPEDGTVTLYLPLSGRELYAVSVANQKVTLSLTKGGNPLFLVLPGDPPLLIAGQITSAEPVCARWVTPLFFPEGIETEKSLRALSVTPYPGSVGSVTLGWQTRGERENAGEDFVFGTAGFSFETLSFAAFSFAGETATYTKYLPGRRFRSLRLCFENGEAADFALPLTVVTYARME